MIITSWTTFRYHFQKTYSSGSFQYFAGSPPWIERVAGSFISDGFENEMWLDINGTTNNNKRVSIVTVDALKLTLSDDDSLTNEGPVSSNLDGKFLDPDGVETWPVDNLRANSIGEITGWTKPITTLPLTLTINGGADDAVYGTHEYDWYLSQRTDDTTKQYLSLTMPNAAKSGTVQLGARLLLTITFPDGFTAANRLSIFKHCTLYVQRRSDKAIQLANILYKTETDYT